VREGRVVMMLRRYLGKQVGEGGRNDVVDGKEDLLVGAMTPVPTFIVIYDRVTKMVTARRLGVFQ